MKYSDIPKVKAELLEKQGGVCLICGTSLLQLPERDRCLDHCHKTGRVRGVLCRSCNSFEGRVYKLFVRLGLRKRELDYSKVLREVIKHHKRKGTNHIHPIHNKKKRKKRK